MKINSLAAVFVTSVLLSGTAMAQTPPTTNPPGTSPAIPTAANSTRATTNATPTAPPEKFTVTNYYNQDVYDPNDNKIGSIEDVLINKDGQVTDLIIGVGGFLGVGKKDVAQPFKDVQLTNKNDRWYLTMNADKDQLKSAQGLRYDRKMTTWVPDNSEASPPAQRQQ
jgi:sporulation protein YlmC with PRC-barrel domain